MTSRLTVDGINYIVPFGWDEADVREAIGPDRIDADLCFRADEPIYARVIAAG